MKLNTLMRSFKVLLYKLFKTSLCHNFLCPDLSIYIVSAIVLFKQMSGKCITNY